MHIRCSADVMIKKLFSPCVNTSDMSCWPFSVNFPLGKCLLLVLMSSINTALCSTSKNTVHLCIYCQKNVYHIAHEKGTAFFFFFFKTLQYFYRCCQVIKWLNTGLQFGWKISICTNFSIFQYENSPANEHDVQTDHTWTEKDLTRPRKKRTRDV